MASRQGLYRVLWSMSSDIMMIIVGVWGFV